MTDFLKGYVPVPATGGLGFMGPPDDDPAAIKQTIADLCPAAPPPSAEYVFVPPECLPRKYVDNVCDLTRYYAADLGIPPPYVTFFANSRQGMSPPWLDSVEPTERPLYFWLDRPMYGFVSSAALNRIWLNVDTPDLLATIAHETAHAAGFLEPEAKLYGEEARAQIEEDTKMRGKPEGFATKDQTTEKCILRSHRDYAGTSCVSCGREVPPLPWSPEQFAEHGVAFYTNSEYIAKKGVIPQAPDPAAAAIPETDEERAAQAAVVESLAAYDSALKDLNRIKWVLGEYVLSTSSGYQTVGDQRATEQQREQAKAMRPQALEAVDAADERLRAARIEVQRLSRIAEAKRRQWHLDHQESLARASAAKAATARATPFRAFMQRLAK